MEDVKHWRPTSIVKSHFFSAGIRPLELDRYFLFVRNALRRKVNQRRIQVVEIWVLISIIGFPMLVARGGYRVSPRGGRPMINWCLNAIE